MAHCACSFHVLFCGLLLRLIVAGNAEALWQTLPTVEDKDDGSEKDQRVSGSTSSSRKRGKAPVAGAGKKSKRSRPDKE